MKKKWKLLTGILLMVMFFGAIIACVSVKIGIWKALAVLGSAMTGAVIVQVALRLIVSGLD
ncbi:hypothetical protein LI031_09805 [Enterocloster citroniae]|uniref:hypothetical protein n=1 Tax=Enterocloster citroniae TaxID=358743 RepID=UPI001D063339|nr:hypothetical protein [Enterocloster citroniae]MCB7064134.1 hypothetical protein [Enterocloster citroniae]